MINQFGRAGVILLTVAVAAGLVVAVTAPRGQSRIVVWTFEQSSADSYPREFEGRRVEATVTPGAILNARVGARAMSAEGHAGQSYLVELDINSIGKFVNRSGAAFLLPLGEGDVGGLWPGRVRTWRNGGVQIAVPRDVHPVVVAYRKDLWAGAGVDPAGCATWEQLLQACRRYDSFYAGNEGGRRSMELSRGGEIVYLILQQRGLAIVPSLDAGESSVSTGRGFTNPAVAETIGAYAEWLQTSGAGDEAVGRAPARTIAQTAAELLDGRVGAVVVADWRLGQLRTVEPRLKGLLSLMPLPVFTPGDAPTASWGGTAVAIPADSPDVEVSRKLLREVGADVSRAVGRYQQTLILPPMEAAWGDAEMRKPDEFFDAATPPSVLLPALARRAPEPQTLSPLTSMAQLELNLLVSRAVANQRRDASTMRARLDDDLAAAEGRLRAAAARIRGHVAGEK